MKQITSILLLAIIIGFTSCKKEDDPRPTSKTKLEYLTSKTWIYDEYFTGYNTTNTLLAYKKGKANNSMNLSLNRVKFNSDGTVNEITETGAQLNGTWKFLNNETQTEVTNAAGVHTATIIFLDDARFEWHGESVGRYAKMIPIN